jgi:hypothetical protein
MGLTAIGSDLAKPENDGFRSAGEGLPQNAQKTENLAVRRRLYPTVRVRTRSWLFVRVRGRDCFRSGYMGGSPSQTIRRCERVLNGVKERETVFVTVLTKPRMTGPSPDKTRTDSPDGLRLVLFTSDGSSDSDTRLA